MWREMRERFGQDKIYLMGHSGGTFVGIGLIWAATPTIDLQGHVRYTSAGEVADSGSDAFDDDILVGVNGRWYFRPDFALVAGYEFGKITTVNVGVRYSF